MDLQARGSGNTNRIFEIWIDAGVYIEITYM